MRTKYGEYPEYHTSLDNLKNVVTPSGLEGGYEIYKKIIKTLENNIFIESNIKGEPHLSKRKLYPSISTLKTASKVKSMMNVLSYVDGITSIIQIANLCHLSTLEVKKYLKTFKKFNLIK